MNSTTLPAGTYIVGDPGYSIEDREEWLEWVRLSDRSGDLRFFDGESSGFRIVAHKTEHGDGLYTDNFGRNYSVDSGLIGMIPLAYMHSKPNESVSECLALGVAHVVTFDNEVTFRYFDGEFTFTDGEELVKIETDWEFK